MKTMKLGLLPRILIAIVLGIFGNIVFSHFSQGLHLFVHLQRVAQSVALILSFR